jgi:hypothetical protein
MTHKDEAPHKVEAIKKYLIRVFQDQRTQKHQIDQIHHFFEPDRSLQSFRVEDADCCLISFGEDYFFDLPHNEDGIVNRLTEARLPHHIRDSDSNTRILVIWDTKISGQPKIVTEPLDPTRRKAAK